MEFKDFTITKREVLVSVIIVVLLITFGFFISNEIENNIEEKNEKYYKSLKINNDEDKFKYAIETNIGYTLATGKIKAVDAVIIEDIEGSYLKIRKIKEKYTRHTRQVEHTRQVGNKTETYYTTEVYYTWDYSGEEEFHSKQFEFLGVQFSYDILYFNNEQYKETIKVNSDTRYRYYIIPFEFNGCLFTNIKNNTINENEFYFNDTIENIISNKQKESQNSKIVFWFIWVIIIIFIVGIFVYAENKYLEDKT